MYNIIYMRCAQQHMHGMAKIEFVWFRILKIKICIYYEIVYIHMYSYWATYILLGISLEIKNWIRKYRIAVGPAPACSMCDFKIPTTPLGRNSVGGIRVYYYPVEYIKILCNLYMYIPNTTAEIEIIMKEIGIGIYAIESAAIWFNWHNNDIIYNILIRISISV